MEPPFDILDGELDEEERRAVQDPENYNFRPEPQSKIPVTPDARGMVAAGVDVVNQNIDIRAEFHSTREKYTHVHDGEDFSIVESNRTYEVNDRKGLTELYYLVKPEETFVYGEEGYTERANPWPREVAEAAPGIYRKALEKEEIEDEVPVKKVGKLDHVPPPRNE
jgi:hypothetical protein